MRNWSYFFITDLFQRLQNNLGNHKLVLYVAPILAGVTMILYLQGLTLRLN
jgi:hypothetical protein